MVRPLSAQHSSPVGVAELGLSSAKLPQLQVGGLLEQGEGCVGRGDLCEVDGSSDRGAININLN